MIDCTSLHVLDCWTRDAILGAADPSATDTVPCDIMGGHYIFDTEFGCIDISDDEDLDKQIKKLTVNINIGLLEKTGSTSQKSVLLKNLNEALNLQQRTEEKIKN